MSAIPRAVVFRPQALLTVKLLAFVWMICDHADMFFGGGLGAHATLGRLVFPIFGSVLAYNLTRCDADRILGELVPRAIAVGVVAQFFYAHLQGALVPLNIMFTLAAAMAVYAFTTRREWWLAGLVFLLSGLFVDYSWQGITGVVIVAYGMRSSDPLVTWGAVTVFCVLLAQFFGNVWPLAAVPALWAASTLLRSDAPRWRAVFWVGYPAHLAVLTWVKFS